MKNFANKIQRVVPKPSKDEMDSFEKLMEKVARDEVIEPTEDGLDKVLKTHRFDLLRALNYKASKTNVDIAKGYVDLTREEKDLIAATVFKKGKQMKNLNRGIFLNGFVEFEDYESKLRFLNSPPYRFGMKFYDQQRSINFKDADFANTLSLGSRKFSQKSLSQIWSLINSTLMDLGFEGEDLCTVGKLKALPDFNLEDAIVQPRTRISIRFHNFLEAKKALYFFNQARFNVKYVDPTTMYYDAKFSTMFENAIKNKFEGLDHTIEVPSNYAKERLAQLTQNN